MTVRWNLSYEDKKMQLRPEITILYEDASLLVCIKPAGIASQGSKGFQTDLSDMLKLHIQKETGVKGEPYLGIIHRLDQPVGGIMVYAKEPKSAAVLSAQAASDAMKKRYYMVLEKRPPEDTGILKDYLLRDGRTNTSCVVEGSCKAQNGAKLAELSFRILKEAELEGKKLYLAEAELKTGRHHQIRVQFAHAGCPLYGDRKYNPDTKGRELALFSHYLEFTHPETKKKLQFDRKPTEGSFRLFF